jgi:hypothetical protein
MSKNFYFISIFKSALLIFLSLPICMLARTHNMGELDFLSSYQQGGNFCQQRRKAFTNKGAKGEWVWSILTFANKGEKDHPLKGRAIAVENPHKCCFKAGLFVFNSYTWRICNG